MKKFFFSAVFLFSALFVTSCSQDDVPTQNAEGSASTASNSNVGNRVVTEGSIPFTVENVTAALPNVLEYYKKYRPEVAKNFSKYQVDATHLYYKFMPADSTQYKTLMEYDEKLKLTVDPFEYSVVERTEDPGENEIPVFYSVAERDAAIPNVPYEVIAKLHFTNEDNLEEIRENYNEIEFKQNLMYEARKLARHLDEEEIREGYMNYDEGVETGSQAGSLITVNGLFGSKWRPSGSVKVQDDYLTQKKGSAINLGVNRAEVNVLKWGWLRVENGSTDANGNFSTGTTYTKHVHYNVKFTDFFKVKVLAGNFWDVANWKSDSHKRRSLNVVFMPNTKHQFYALINNAAWDYFNRVVPTYGVYNPQKIEISGHFNDYQSNYWFGFVPFRSEVKLGGKYSNGTRKKSDAIYGTVIHEMTHKSHYKMDSGAFIALSGGSAAKNRLFLRESWAETVETVATNDKYAQYFSQYGLGSYVASNNNNTGSSMIKTMNGRRQYETISQMNEYTSLIYDVIDTYNQGAYSSIYHQDLVSGYTLLQVQSALNNSHTATAFYDKLYNNYTNSTKVHLTTLKGHANTVISNL